MKKKKCRNEAGVTPIEIIIVLAIIGILASASVLLIGHLHYADTERVINNIDTTMNELQIKNISKAEQSICIFIICRTVIICGYCPMI